LELVEGGKDYSVRACLNLAIFVGHDAIDNQEWKGGRFGGFLRRDRLVGINKLHADKLPPIFIVRAGKDSPGLNGTIDRFVTEAASRDVAIEFHNIRGVPHAFDVQTPSSEVRSVIARVIAFMKASLEQ
jgi:dienelactone hydrolase